MENKKQNIYWDKECTTKTINICCREVIEKLVDGETEIYLRSTFLDRIG